MEKIDIKKVQVLGRSKYICLPPTWTDDHDIEKGQELDIFREGNELIIKPPRKAAEAV